MFWSTILARYARITFTLAIGMKEEMPFSQGKYSKDLKMCAGALFPEGLTEARAVRLTKGLSQYPRISPIGVIRPFCPPDIMCTTRSPSGLR